MQTQMREDNNAHADADANATMRDEYASNAYDNTKMFTCVCVLYNLV